jgi:hypothetical protein
MAKKPKAKTKTVAAVAAAPTLAERHPQTTVTITPGLMLMNARRELIEWARVWRVNLVGLWD